MTRRYEIRFEDATSVALPAVDFQDAEFEAIGAFLAEHQREPPQRTVIRLPQACVVCGAAPGREPHLSLSIKCSDVQFCAPCLVEIMHAAEPPRPGAENGTDSPT